jgi:hypothetical protein
MLRGQIAFAIFAFYSNDEREMKLNCPLIYRCGLLMCFELSFSKVNDKKGESMIVLMGLMY